MTSLPVITPAILCGGYGTRLWPLSRKSYPKQFVPLLDEGTLFQASARRLSGEGPGFAFDAPMLLTSSDFRFLVSEQLMEIGIDPGAILLEPSGRNTAPAVLVAALCQARKDPQGILLVAPSDHAIPDTAPFHAAVARGLEAVERGELVTFGITPDRPETAYGYLELSALPAGDGAPIPLAGFREKPDRAGAEAMLAAGTYLWNAGIFLFRAADMIAAYEAHAPGLIAPVRAALEEAETDLGFLRLAPEPWAEAENISVDYAVMEKAENLSAVPLEAAWSDLGDWQAIWGASARDETGVATRGAVTAIGCRDSLLRSEAPELELVGIGLENILVVAMQDSVLVADMSRAQDVKLAVEALKKKGAAQAESFPKVHRPWGWFEGLVLGPRFQVKRIMVRPGAALSLQSHFHRAEHWVVVEGTARVTVDDEVRLVTENQSAYIPTGAVHRLENPGKVPVVVIEVQTGSYVGEDDIIRYEDVYARE
ncbi:Alginate biosynthesis protein AlgA [Pseudooceanicola marinus]|uniref:mannose-1-phosphate guanylyltransferase n=1 Tax=Pseudooceanicola marinus TaxID=396013 RepID=A0A1X7AAM1_9RHOB|nr:mannose-1-phosphate guanylyltransferase/mannose-6-phosphate isomerase [Pseudooceanicola marinus]SLN74420.1 Alginate biosynthesis protein AlgA [Pseudooceanicola marinus]